MLLRSWLTLGWLHICVGNKRRRVSQAGIKLGKAVLNLCWSGIKAVTNLGSFPLLNANTVKSLDEVVQHLCLFARFNGEAVAG